MLDEKVDNQLILLPSVLGNDVVIDKVFGNEESLKIKKFLSNIDLDYLKKNNEISNEEQENERDIVTPYLVFFQYKDTNIALWVSPISMSISINPAVVRDNFEEKVYTAKCCYFKRYLFQRRFSEFSR